jgi:hypothetical protein
LQKIGADIVASSEVYGKEAQHDQHDKHDQHAYNALIFYKIFSRWSILHLHQLSFRTTCYATRKSAATETAAGNVNGARMPELTIADNATIADIVDDLNAPEEFVRQVLEHMEECWRQHDAASVRIGVTGRGRAPYYRIEHQKSPSSVFAVYRGLGHKQIEDLGERPAIDIFAFLGEGPSKPEEQSPDHIFIDEHWSSRVMILDEVQKLLGQLRQRRR